MREISRLLFLCLLLVSTPFANGFDIPENVIVVTAPEAKKMVETDGVLLVHVLSLIEYNMQHIAGSINIPVDQLEGSTLLPPNKSEPVIFYCNGTACPYSRRASKKAAGMG